jgi:hypothetical protein
VRHLKGGALFPCRLFLVAGHLSCDNSSIDATLRDFRDITREVGLVPSCGLWYREKNLAGSDGFPPAHQHGNASSLGVSSSEQKQSPPAARQAGFCVNEVPNHPAIQLIPLSRNS